MRPRRRLRRMTLRPSRPKPTAPAFSQEQLDQMLAPIALYPDSLLIQLMMSSTYPLEIVEADRWRKKNASLAGEALEKALEAEDWDPSVKAMALFPDLLGRMSENLDWTQDLGDAFLSQQPQVLDTVQALRKQAYEAGNLKTSEQQNVVVDEGDQVIEIEPAKPETVYVPQYNSAAVYGTPPPAQPYYPEANTYSGTDMLMTGALVFRRRLADRQSDLGRRLRLRLGRSLRLRRRWLWRSQRDQDRGRREHRQSSRERQPHRRWQPSGSRRRSPVVAAQPEPPPRRQLSRHARRARRSRTSRARVPPSIAMRRSATTATRSAAVAGQGKVGTARPSVAPSKIGGGVPSKGGAPSKIGSAKAAPRVAQGSVQGVGHEEADAEPGDAEATDQRHRVGGRQSSDRRRWVGRRLGDACGERTRRLESRLVARREGRRLQARRQQGRQQRWRQAPLMRRTRR